ncbi:nuclear transport factor 2 family protein [Parasphingorhabdus cellanae]|uniref:Nuclear transport factor 2 family protein n=1 Tax=Parasphingorhabdus cellanae TaxID=2806553 RepID=A0ABX7T7B3_9SPHN|nr:nuclear transport factor 2 family protein [Parasphingorhabdus cellanae]QTD56022.1 nuclear transport factor 2 family protein [Parasphingorhabdus cellanae]
MDRLAIAADKLECTELVTRVARAIDRCDAELLKTLFHPDATDDHGIFVGSVDEFIEWVMPLLATMKRTQHIIGQVLIEVDGDHAVGESYFIAHHAMNSPEGDILMIAAGRYLDRFERRDGCWKISHRHAVYDWNSVEPMTDSYDRANPASMTLGTRGTSDASYSHLASQGITAS